MKRENVFTRMRTGFGFERSLCWGNSALCRNTRVFTCELAMGESYCQESRASRISEKLEALAPLSFWAWFPKPDILKLLRTHWLPPTPSQGSFPTLRPPAHTHSASFSFLPFILSKLWPWDLAVLTSQCSVLRIMDTQSLSFSLSILPWRLMVSSSDSWLHRLHKKGVCTAGETTQWLRAFAALAENLDSVPSTYIRQLPTTYNSH